MHLIVHGGAGSAPEEPTVRQGVVEEAAAAGAAAATPTLAVERAVRRLESSPRFNAGVGSALQADGAVRADAGIATEDATGAACSLTGVRHPVRVARLVMEETPHVLLAGDGAIRLAAAFGLDTDADLRTERTVERFEAADPPEGDDRERLAWVRERFGRDGHDTVGAVAFDGERLAAATSTGGRPFAFPGRVGDVPQVGGGFYASAAAAASATGAGEEIAEVGLSRLAVRRVEEGADAGTAARAAIEAFEDRTGAHAGVTVLDGAGRSGSAHNAEAMQTAVSRS